MYEIIENPDDGEPVEDVPLVPKTPRKRPSFLPGLTWRQRVKQEVTNYFLKIIKLPFCIRSWTLEYKLYATIQQDTCLGGSPPCGIHGPF